ncbi:MAG: hypothetical protein JWL81_403 [Verrucomicrobiales bacterium]|nr:hypothetical protein [Verrucomicrobiales bacterium]
MMSFHVLYLVIGLLLALMTASWFIQRFRRRTGALRVRHFAFPSRWLEYLEANVPLYRRLPVDLRDRLQDRILNFVDGKRWKHCGGLEAVTDEMKVTIAGQACFLLLGRAAAQDFARVLTIMVYPTARGTEDDPDSVLPPVESWPSASVLLAWDEVKKTARDLRDDRNEVIHEFARQLDLEDGRADGKPILQDPCQHTAWARVMNHAFVNASPPGDSAAAGSWPDRLHAGEPGENFAAGTELFYQNPAQLEKRHPDLYGLLRDFYKLDPARWLKR